MDHPASVSRPYVWRTTAFVAAAIATFELVLLIVVLVSLAGPGILGADGSAKKASAGKKRAPAAAPGTNRAPAPRLSRAETSVMVLNGNGVPDAAGKATLRLRPLNYVVAGAANAPRNDFAHSLVMFRPGYRGEAARLARDLHIGRIAPLDGLRPSDLQGAHVALIVGGS